MSNLQWPPPTEALASFYAACAEPCEWEREIIQHTPKSVRGAVHSTADSRLPVGPDGVDAETVVLWLYRQGWPARQVTAQLIRRERIEGETRFLKQATVFANTPAPTVAYTQPQHGVSPASPRPVVGELEKIALRVLADPALALQGFAVSLQAVGEAWGKSVETGRLSAAEGAKQEIRAMIQEEARLLAGQATRATTPTPSASAPTPSAGQIDPNQIVSALRSMMDAQNQKIDALARELAEMKRGQG